jgi:hypothetical protein
MARSAIDDAFAPEKERGNWDDRQFEDVARDVVDQAGGGWEGVDAARTAAWDALDAGFQGSGDQAGRAIGGMFAAEGDPHYAAFGSALAQGGDYHDAWQAADQQAFEQAGFQHGPQFDQQGLYQPFDFIANSAFSQGFDPFLAAAAQIEDTFAVFQAEASLADNTINVFERVIVATSGPDQIRGDERSESIVMRQGSTLGGSDTIDGGAGTDELTFTNLSDIIFVFDVSANPNRLVYSTGDSSVTGNATVENTIEQIFFSDRQGDTQRLATPGAGESGFGIAIAGSEGDDVINLGAASITVGSVTQSIGSNVFGSIIFGNSGNDVITPFINNNIVRGGSGDDTINVRAETSHFGGTGDDKFIVDSPARLLSIDMIGGGNNSARGDVVQLGDANTQSGLTFGIGGQFSNLVGGIETLDVFPSSSLIVSNGTQFFQFSAISTQANTTGVILQSQDQTLNLSNATLGAGIAQLQATGDFGSGVTIRDGADANGRILIGTSDADNMSGFGGDDRFILAGGNDEVAGGDGADIFVISSNNDVVSGLRLSGGNQTDTLLVTSTAVDDLNFGTTSIELISVESIDLTGGSDSGVNLRIPGFALNQVRTLTGDGTTDTFTVNSESMSNTNITYNGINVISVDDPRGRDIHFSDDTTFTNVTSVTMKSGITNAGVTNEIALGGDFDFSNFTITTLRVDIGVSELLTISLNNTTSFGVSPIQDFSIDRGDRFNFRSDLVAGDGTPIDADDDDLDVTDIASAGGSTTHISGSSEGVVDFEFSRLSEALDGTSTIDAIVSAVETLLDSTTSSSNLTGSNDALTQGANGSDMLLIFRSASDANDSVIVRYQEDTNADTSFAGEVSVVALVDNVGNFTDANFV